MVTYGKQRIMIHYLRFLINASSCRPWILTSSLVLASWSLPRIQVDCVVILSVYDISTATKCNIRSSSILLRHFLFLPPLPPFINSWHAHGNTYTVKSYTRSRWLLHYQQFHRSFSTSLATSRVLPSLARLTYQLSATTITSGTAWLVIGGGDNRWGGIGIGSSLAGCFF